MTLKVYDGDRLLREGYDYCVIGYCAIEYDPDWTNVTKMELIEDENT